MFRFFMIMIMIALSLNRGAYLTREANLNRGADLNRGAGKYNLRREEFPELERDDTGDTVDYTSFSDLELKRDGTADTVDYTSFSDLEMDPVEINIDPDGTATKEEDSKPSALQNQASNYMNSFTGYMQSLYGWTEKKYGQTIGQIEPKQAMQCVDIYADNSFIWGERAKQSLPIQSSDSSLLLLDYLKNAFFESGLFVFEQATIGFFFEHATTGNDYTVFNEEYKSSSAYEKKRKELIAAFSPDHVTAFFNGNFPINYDKTLKKIEDSWVQDNVRSSISYDETLGKKPLQKLEYIIRQYDRRSMAKKFLYLFIRYSMTQSGILFYVRQLNMSDQDEIPKVIPVPIKKSYRLHLSETSLRSEAAFTFIRENKQGQVTEIPGIQVKLFASMIWPLQVRKTDKEIEIPFLRAQKCI